MSRIKKKYFSENAFPQEKNVSKKCYYFRFSYFSSIYTLWRSYTTFIIHVFIFFPLNFRFSFALSKHTSKYSQLFQKIL